MTLNAAALLLLQFLQGFIVGAGAVLPGISGGALCVSFGYYATMIEIISNPIKGVKKHLKTVLAFGIGWIAAFFVCAGMMGWLFAEFELEATLVFGGLIFGSMPSLFRDAKKDGLKKYSFTSYATALVVSSLLLMLCKTQIGAVTPNLLWYAFVGVLWALSLIFPGLNTTPVTVSLGLYDSWANGVAGFDLSVMLPWIAALALTAFALSRTVTGLINKHYCLVSHAMLGIVTSSTLMMLGDSIMSNDILAGITPWLILPLLVGGFVIATLLDDWSAKLKQKQAAQTNTK